MWSETGTRVTLFAHKEFQTSKLALILIFCERFFITNNDTNDVETTGESELRMCGLTL